MEGGTAEAAEFAFKASFMHWGFLPWVNYSVVGLTLAYFMFRKNKKGLISTLVEPLIGEKLAAGWLGKLIDFLGDHPVGYGSWAFDGRWIEATSDNFACSSVPIYFHNVWNLRSIYQSTEE